MTNSNRKVLEKLRRLERLAQGAGSEGERAAAEAARRRLVERLEKEGVHVAPELMAEVGAEQTHPPQGWAPDGPTVDVAEELAWESVVVPSVIEPLMSPSHDPSSRTVVASPVSVSVDPPAQASESWSPAPELTRARESWAFQEVHPHPPQRNRSSLHSHPPPPHRASPHSNPPQRGRSSVHSIPPQPERSSPLPKTPPLGRQPYDRAAAMSGVFPPQPSRRRYAQPTPPWGVPLASGPASGRRTVRTPARPPARSRWNPKAILLTILVCVLGLEVSAFFLAPDPRRAAMLRSEPSGEVEERTDACNGGEAEACAGLGAAISGHATESGWASTERSSCTAGDQSACTRLGQRYAAEARRRTQKTPERATRAGDLFLEVACALGASSCPEE